MRTVAEHKHIRTHPSRTEVLGWVGLHLSTSTRLCRSTGFSRGIAEGLFSATPLSHLFSPFFFFLHIFKYLLWFTRVFMFCFFCLLLRSCGEKKCLGCCYIFFFLSFCCKKKCTQTSNSVDALPNKMLFNCDGVLLWSVFAQFYTHSKQAKVPRREKKDRKAIEWSF